jgi:chitinase
MKTRLLITSFLLVASLPLFSQKIVGYLPSYRNPSPTLIQYSKMTHVLYAFINPNSNGDLVGVTIPNIGDANYDFGMNNFIVAKSNCYPMVPNGPKLIISVGGADAGNVRSTNLSTVCGNSTTRANFIAQIVSFAITNNLAGIDIDWEFPTATADKNNHQSLLTDLRAAITASTNPNLRIGITIGGETTGSPNHTQYINTASLAYVDDFNIMAYDLPISYNANNHSALTNMAPMIANWNTFGVPLSKMVLGVPFYGRTPARVSTNGEYNTFTSGLTGAALTTAFTSDGPSTTGGFYYNGQATLQAKVDLIITTNCGQGVMIWDVGQDRTDAYSLLSVLYSEVNTVACTMAQPNLGADINFCGTTTTLTAAGTSATSYVWKRNGTTVATTTTNSYTISQGGTWTVTAIQGCCQKTDEIIVTQGSVITAPGNNRCGSGIINLSVTSTGSTYDWFDASTGGNYLSTGSIYSPSITATTTYYVEQNAGNSTYYTGKTYPGSSPQKEYADYSGKAHWANKMVVSQTLTIQSVDIYYSGPAVSSARLVAYSSADGLTPVYQSTPVNLPAQTTTALAAGFPYTLNTNLTLPAGTYYMAIYAPGADAQGADPGVTLDPNGIATPYTQAGLFSIGGQAFVNWSGGFNASSTPSANYGQLFNWVITAASNPCGRTAVVAAINCPPVVALTSPAPPGPVAMNVGVAITLTVTASDDGSIASVVYEIRNASTNVLITTITGGTSPTYMASWTPTSGISYKIRAVATDNTALSTSTADVTVNVSLPVTLLSFDAEKENEVVLVTWATANEINNDYFAIERSSDGNQFESIGSVKGNKNSNTLLDYVFTDEQPLYGKSYYRLAQYDFDGTKQESEIRTVDYSTASLITISPNPFEEMTNLSVSPAGTAFKIKIISLQGSLMEEQEYTSDDRNVYTIGKSLNPGVYILTISTPQNTVTYKIEKLN